MTETNRDPERVLTALRAVLAACPSLRVGQAIANALPPRFCSDPFYVDDHTLASGLEAYARAHRAPAVKEPTR